MRIPITLTMTLAISGCASPMAGIAYNSASAVSVATTNKSLAEHGASTVTQSDCSMLNYLFMNKDYLCEQRDPGTTYNRNGL
jgi:hypothetical protein